LRGAGGVAGGGVLEDGGGGADADCLEDRRPHPAARRQASAQAAPPTGRAAPAGIERDLLPQGQRYLTVVVDHDTRRLVWAAEGRDEETLHRFFRALGRRRSVRITHVSADGAWWISKVVRFHCPK